jgi:hypothetical protein
MKRIAMKHRIATCLVIALSSLAAPRPAAAAATDVYDTVDSVELNDGAVAATLVVTGIPAGGTIPIATTYSFGGFHDTAMHCQRLAVVAMSKPGKFQFAIATGSPTAPHSCKLSLRAP